MGRGESFNTSMQRLQGDLMKRVTGYRTLKSFIRELRACPTAAAERDLISRELASIRTALKTTCNAIPAAMATDLRWQSMAKLVYCGLVAPKVASIAFAQVEAVKLAAGERVRDKRLGYLAVHQLLDEAQPTLTLVTNSLKSDLRLTDGEDVVGLALSAMATVASRDIARDLADEVARLLHASSDANIRKRATACAVQLVRQAPDLAELFIDAAESQFKASLASSGGSSGGATRRRSGFPGRASEEILASSHSVVLTACHLLTAIITTDTIEQSRFLNAIPTCLKHLKSLAGSHDECSVNGIDDPFLQCALLALLRSVLALHIAIPLNLRDSITDTLTVLCGQYATCTQSSAYAVAYQLVDCILSSTAALHTYALRNAALSLLARFLAASDGDIRFVALSVLNGVDNDSLLTALGSHQSTILACLHDTDPSIRHEAGKLALSMCTHENVDSVLRELLMSIEEARQASGQASQTNGMLLQMAKVANRCAPDAEWYVTFMMGLLSRLPDGNEDDGLIRQFIDGIEAREAQALAVNKLKDSLSSSTKMGCVKMAAIWAVGEWTQHLTLDGEEELPVIIAQLGKVDGGRLGAMAVFALAKIYGSLAEGDAGEAKKAAAKTLQEMQLSANGEAERLRTVVLESIRCDPTILTDLHQHIKERDGSTKGTNRLEQVMQALDLSASPAKPFAADGFKQIWADDDTKVEYHHRTAVTDSTASKAIELTLRVTHPVDAASPRLQFAVPRTLHIHVDPEIVLNVQSFEQHAIISAPSPSEHDTSLLERARVRVKVVKADKSENTFDISSLPHWQ